MGDQGKSFLSSVFWNCWIGSSLFQLFTGFLNILYGTGHDRFMYIKKKYQIHER